MYRISQTKLNPLVTTTAWCLCLFFFSSLTFAQAKYVILFGAPGAGKTTQSQLLVEKHGLMYINFSQVIEKRLLEIYYQTMPTVEISFDELTDDSFSDELNRSHQVRAKRFAKAYQDIKSGQFVPDDAMNVIMAQTLFTQDYAKGFVIDGFPMTVNQASFLDTVFDNIQAIDYANVKIVYVNVPDDVALKRMHKRGRLDDQIGFAEARLRDFRSKMQPILDYYGDYIIEIDGTQSVDKVAQQIEQAIHKQTF